MRIPRLTVWPHGWTWFSMLWRLDTFMHRFFFWCEPLWHWAICNLFERRLLGTLFSDRSRREESL